MSLMRVVLSGLVETEPEKRFTPNNVSVANFTLAVFGVANAKATGLADAPYLIKVVCWRGLSDAIAEQVRKGQYVVVEGRLTNNTFTGQDGSIKRTVEMEASSVELLAGPSTPIVVSNTQGGGMSANPGGASPQNSAFSPAASPSPRQPQPAYAGAAAPRNNGLDFTADDLMTEDDIPF